MFAAKSFMIDLCFAIIGEPETTQPFVSGIASNLNADTLKKTICESEKGLFEGVKSPSSLVLYRVSLPSSDHTSDRKFSEDDTKPQMVMTGAISGYFKDGAEEDRIHIIVKRPNGMSSISTCAVHVPMTPYYSTILPEPPYSHPSAPLCLALPTPPQSLDPVMLPLTCMIPLLFFS
jgi:hypothetical protein